MTYQETVKWLFSQLPMFQRQGKPAFKKDLSNIRALCKLNDNPQKKFKSIHIAGTNGKGSVSHILSSIMQTAGFKIGLYTSPHLKDFRERIKINGNMISEDCVIDFVDRFMPDFIKIKPSFFEMSVAMAFDHFAKNDVDLSIIEVGLGGRLDSTNIITPILSVITNISFDHTQFLGDTIEEITEEKSGIIKPNVTVLVGETNDKTKPIFINKAKLNNSDIYFADNKYKVSNSYINKNFELCMTIKSSSAIFENISTDVSGNYQQKNIVTSINAVDIISDQYIIKPEDIIKGIRNIRRNTDFKGRWDILNKKPLIIADTGHNVAGITEITDQLKSLSYKNLHIILGLVNDKKTDDILNLMPKDALYYFTKANIPRSMDESVLQNTAKSFRLKGNKYSTVFEAFHTARKNAGNSDIILICGSTFLVAEII